jgi:hypothetical protein
MPDLAAAATVGSADHNIEAGGDSVPVVPHLRLAAGRNFMTAGDGASDFSGLAALTRSRRFLCGGRQLLRIDLHSAWSHRFCEARRTKRDRQARTEKWFHFELNGFGSLLQAKRAKSRRVPQMAELRPPTLENDLVGPTRGHPAVFLRAYSPGQQRQSKYRASEQGCGRR